MKSYTDIEQSKALVKILPIETADCFWDYDEMQKFHRISWFEDGFNKESQLMLNENNVCAWSLAALLNIIPGGQVNRMANSDKWEASSWNDSDYEPAYYVEDYDNPVNACVEMIEKLYELKLI